MNKKTLNITLMIMFFFITTAFILASFPGSKDTRSRASVDVYGGVSLYGRVAPRITPTPIRRITPTIPSGYYRGLDGK